MRLDLYVVTDEEISRGRSHQQIARLALAGGADVIQLRAKDMDGGKMFEVAREIRSLTTSARALLIVNDHLDVALAARADGVHLGQDDLPVSEARRISPPGFIIGASVGSVEEAIKAERDGADYVALSPVFNTASKEDAGPGHGLEVMEVLKGAVSIPIVGIGGITLDNVSKVIAAGADGIAVISAVVSQEDVTGAAQLLKAHIEMAKTERAPIQ
ncbi:MAG: thiamine phosphate synthase [Euryarchaeota archaeon]|nr:thiamine phosphate synthase [Euryarchaeota archaeon]